MTENYLEKYREKGISSETAIDFMAFDEKDGIMSVNYAKTAENMKLAQDAAPTTANTVGIPAVLLTYVDPLIVPILFGAMNATKIVREERRGDWTKNSMVFTLEEEAGKVTAYSDYNNEVTTDVNFEFPERDNYIFQTGIQYGIRALDVAGNAKLNLVSTKQRKAASVIQRAHNRFYLYGVAGKRTYGLLNDPNLPDSLVPNSITVDGVSKSTWADKSAAAPDNAPNLIYNDVNKIWADLLARNGGNIDQNMKMVLAIAPSLLSYLTAPNVYGLSAKKMLTDNFPNLEIVQLPELATAEGNKLYLVIPELDAVPTAFCAYSEKARFMQVIARPSYWEQKVAAGTWGAIVARPSLIARMTGV